MARKRVAAVVQDPDPGGRGNAGAAGRYRARTARHQHHGLLQGVQRADRGRSAAWSFPAEITIFEDRSFTFITKTPPTSRLLLQAAGLEKGSVAPRREKAGTVTKAQVRQIAETKKPDLNAIDIDGAMAQVAGTARSMGIDVVD